MSAAPIELARPVEFGAVSAPFGAPPASRTAFRTADFNGEVRAGASCNCDMLTLIPHCHGTHTESVAHLTRDTFDTWRIVPTERLQARLVTVTTRAATNGDAVIDAEALAVALGESAACEALVLRSTGVSTSGMPPYLGGAAATLLAERGIDHLVVEWPSIDRLDDGGVLAAHHAFFGLPPGAVSREAATRGHCTVTELAQIPPATADGSYWLALHVPALPGDAVPSRPLLYPRSA